MKNTFVKSLVLLLLFGLSGCKMLSDSSNDVNDMNEIVVKKGSRSEVQFPDADVTIISPEDEEVTEEDVSVEIEVDGYELGAETEGYKEKGLAYSKNGQHLHVILDDQPYNAIYDVSDPIELEDLDPGFHVLQAFPSRQWHESVKSPNAFDYVTFYVNEEEESLLDTDEPFLVYSRPKGTYKGKGAKKIMFDFYVENCEIGPDDYTLELVIDGEHVETIDEWVPYWVKGLKPGEHTFEVTLLDPDGDPVENGFNPIERTVNVKE